MSETANTEGWRYCHFRLFVTGKGEYEFLPDLFRPLLATGRCAFTVERRIGQRSVITSPKRRAKMVGSGKVIPDRDAEQIGLPARKYLQGGQDRFVLLIDDLEGDRAPEMEHHYARYRHVLDTMLGPLAHRASVHFLTNMLEAYYFAHADAINHVLGTALADYAGDVETIRHPKKDLKHLFQGFDEIEHGREIMKRLDTAHVLSNPVTCRSLRTVFAWCWEVLGLSRTSLFQLAQGQLHPVTGSQIAALSTALRPPPPQAPESGS
jgi:hypothetical protein